MCVLQHFYVYMKLT